jgi:hypothetical protein
VPWEKMQMVPPYIFLSKINRNSRQRHMVPFKIRHVAIIYIFFLILRLVFIIIIIFGVAPFGPHGGGRPPPFGLGVVRPPPDRLIWHGGGQTTPVAHGVGSAIPRAKREAKKIEGFALGWLNHPRRPQEWFGHPQAKWGGWPSSCATPTIFFYFF